MKNTHRCSNNDDDDDDDDDDETDINIICNSYKRDFVGKKFNDKYTNK